MQLSEGHVGVLNLPSYVEAELLFLRFPPNIPGTDDFSEVHLNHYSLVLKSFTETNMTGAYYNNPCAFLDPPDLMGPKLEVQWITR